MLTAHIVTGNQTYIVEPLWRHFTGNDALLINHNDMLVYQPSDMRLIENSPFSQSCHIQTSINSSSQENRPEVSMNMQLFALVNR